MGSLQRIGLGLTAVALLSPMVAPAEPLGVQVVRAATPPLVARAALAVRSARAVALDTIAPLPGSPRQTAMVYVHAVEVRGAGRDAWAVDERLTDATGRITIVDRLTTPTRTCERVPVPTRPSSWQCHAGQHNPDPSRLPSGAATTWRPLGTRTLFGVAAQGYETSHRFRTLSVLLHVQYWIDPTTARPVIVQVTFPPSGAGLARTPTVVLAVRYTRWDDPRLARLIPTRPGGTARRTGG